MFNNYTLKQIENYNNLSEDFADKIEALQGSKNLFVFVNRDISYIYIMLEFYKLKDLYNNSLEKTSIKFTFNWSSPDTTLFEREEMILKGKEWVDHTTPLIIVYQIEKHIVELLTEMNFIKENP